MKLTKMLNSKVKSKFHLIKQYLKCMMIINSETEYI